MLSVWPFRNRSLRHRTFGRLKSVRSGRYWHARVDAPFARRPIDVHISAGKSGPTAEQELLFLRLREQYPTLVASALRAVHHEYRRVRAAQPHLRWPAAEDLATLEDLAPLGGIWLDDHDGRQFMLSFDHRDDKDHAFHVFFDGDRVKSVASERE